MNTRRLVVVGLGGFRVGLDVHRVVEVHRMHAERPVVPVPGAPAAVRGLVNLRGQLASVVAARTALGIPAREGTGAVHVVIRIGSGVVVFEVDGEDGLVDVAPADSFETPGHLPAALAAVVVCVHPLNDALLLEVDIDRMFSSASRSDVSTVGGLLA